MSTSISTTSLYNRVHQFCKENGICTNCQKRPSLHDNNLCESCKRKNVEYATKSRKNRVKGA